MQVIITNPLHCVRRRVDVIFVISVLGAKDIMACAHVVYIGSYFRREVSDYEVFVVGIQFSVY